MKIDDKNISLYKHSSRDHLIIWTLMVGLMTLLKQNLCTTDLEVLCLEVLIVCILIASILCQDISTKKFEHCLHFYWRSYSIISNIRPYVSCIQGDKNKLRQSSNSFSADSFHLSCRYFVYRYVGQAAKGINVKKNRNVNFSATF